MTGGIDFNAWGPELDTNKPLDFALIKAVSINNLETILNRWMPGGRLHGSEYICGSKQGGPGESCSTNMHTGVGSDFASGEKWGDPIDLIAQIEGCSQGAAAQTLSDFLSVSHNTPMPNLFQPTVSPEAKYEAGKREAMRLWMEGEACPPTHPYLIKKQVTPDSLIRIHPATGNILIPLRDEHNELWSLQRISPDGSEKKLTYQGRLTGMFHVIAGELDTVFICEGYATAMTVNMATRKTCVMTVTAGNIAAVAEKIAAMYPTSRLVFAADNDNVTPSMAGQIENPGVTLATKAAAQIGRGTVIAPPAEPETKIDWNDYAVQHGAEMVRRLLVKDTPQLFVDVQDMTTVEAEFLIEDVIEMPSTGMIFGASGCGKSFFAIDLALCVATGKDWQGHKVKQGPVFYICGEGRHGIPRRVKAWEHHNGIKVPKGRFMVSKIRMNFEPDSVNEMVQCIDQLAESVGQPVMVIVDTMARALPGNADENSAKDVNLFFNEIDRIQHRYSCAVQTVHHSGHADTKRARGSSAIKGVLDVEIMLASGVIEWTKTKDMEPHHPISYELRKIAYGEGKRENSCVIVYGQAEIKEKGAIKMTANMKAALKALTEAIDLDGLNNGGCLLDTWRIQYKGYMGNQTDRAKNKSFKNMINELVASGQVDVAGEMVKPMKIKTSMITDSMFDGLLKGT